MMHYRPSYDELVKDTTTHPTDSITVPDIMATQLRNTIQLTRLDGDSLFNLSEEQEKMTK
jgi:hypothetical protein